MITVRSVMAEEARWQPNHDLRVVRATTYRGAQDGFGDIVFVIYDSIRDGRMERRWKVSQTDGGGAGGILDIRDIEP